MKLKSIFLVVLLSATTAILSVWGYNRFVERPYTVTQEQGKLPVNYAGFFNNDAPVGPVDFTAASTTATPAVVHIKTRTKAKQVTNNLPKRKNPFSDFFGDDDPFSDFFGGPRSQMMPEQRASGSGVLVSQDGYIITNNHVVEGADELSVTLANRKTYKGTVVGTDPNTDLAVVKVDGVKFPYLVYGNSDDVKLGQWVLAVGYPLNLDVTVTAGIVSAKARAIGINRGTAPIESFIQTDAAVNPGNSGGALINTQGELIGINSAIASPTGSYAGYSYAIPVNIVKKTINDLIKYGAVQRAYIGISYPNELMTEEQKKTAGIKDGDGVSVNTGPELQEQVARYKPGDKISITYVRNEKENTVNLTLKNKSGTYAEVKKEILTDRLGGELVTLDAATAKKNGIDGGVQIKKIGTGALKNSRIQEGFIITAVNGQSIKSVDELNALLANATGTVKLEGIYPGYEETYGYPLNLGGDEKDNGDR
jgi:S1-C subfamily serine protease